MDYKAYSETHGHIEDDVTLLSELLDVDIAISKCNSMHTEVAMANFIILPHHLRIAVYNEFVCNPDGRFGDQLIDALDRITRFTRLIDIHYDADIRPEWRQYVAENL